ncbi:magnesium-transporting ATPase (P-type) [Sporosarcina sp. JAI121]|nr:magnesium-transporting ATPase (P-type) [Sporosarcina sp. JAI121]
MTRVILFLISYGLIVITVSNMISYFNYVSLGYDWGQIFYFILHTADFTLFVFSAVIIILTVYVRVPSRLPSSRE